MKYNEVKRNIVENFINRLFRYTYVHSKVALIQKMEEYFPFEMRYNEDVTELTVVLGDGITIPIYLEWNRREHINKTSGNATYTYLLNKVY